MLIETSDTREAFSFELGRLARLWRKRLDERLKATGLTQARWITLLQLSRGGESVTQSELAKLVGIEGPTLVRLLDALEAQGLVERCPVEDDRRANHIRLTRAAEPLLAEINRTAAVVRGELLSDLRADELKACVALFRHVADKLEQ